MKKIHIDDIGRHSPYWEDHGVIYSRITEKLIDELKDRGWTRPMDKERGMDKLANYISDGVIIFYKGKKLTCASRVFVSDSNIWTEVEIIYSSLKPFNRFDYVDLD